MVNDVGRILRFDVARPFGGPLALSPREWDHISMTQAPRYSQRIYMNSEQLAAWLQLHLPRLIPAFLKTRNIEVSHVFNWGGFVNHSFCVADGPVRYHLKITNESDHITRFQTFRDLHELLEERYRTPKLIDWIDLPEIGFAGFLQQHIEGTTPDFTRSPYLVAEIHELLACLHQDTEIQSYLGRTQSGKTYLDHFVETYIERFTSDLKVIASDPPPFISPHLFSFMEEQTHELRKAAADLETFHDPAVEPVHGDLNEGNVLITPETFFVVDWDDLSLGDPAVDFAIAFWPRVYAGKGFWRIPTLDGDPRFTERVDLCLRAQLLDEVIDTIADYVESERVPSKQAEVRLAKKHRHEEALKRYRATYV